jgi:SWI/SNF-related matrix-associated actin-dependent regulator 1 of chromatin subfamily A
LTKPRANESGVGLLMNLRKAANHPLLLRSQYDKQQIKTMANLLKKHDSQHKQAVVKFIEEDMAQLSDFYIHRTCLTYRVSLLQPRLMSIIKPMYFT